MPRKNGQPTPKEQAFAKALAVTGDAKAASVMAGYKRHSNANQIAERGGIREMSFDALRTFVRDKAGQIGVAVLVELAESKETPASTRRAAAKDLTELSGVSKDMSNSKDLADMTGDELQAALTAAKARMIAAEHLAAERARPVIEGLAAPAEAGNDMFD